MADDSVHALLADEELVDCTLFIDGEGMGHLLGDDKAGNLAKGAQLKLALWLALVLAKKNMVRISLPNRYGASVRADLRRARRSSTLHSIAPYYYTVGHKLADATGEDSLRKEPGPLLRRPLRGGVRRRLVASLDRDGRSCAAAGARGARAEHDAGLPRARRRAPRVEAASHGAAGHVGDLQARGAGRVGRWSDGVASRKSTERVALASCPTAPYGR